MRKPRCNACGEQGRWWDRAKAVLDATIIDDGDKTTASLRWLMADDRVHSGIVGTTNLDHLQANVAAATMGALPDGVVAEMNRRYQEVVGG